jgi:hypothetical protein
MYHLMEESTTNEKRYMLKENPEEGSYYIFK